MTLSTSHSKTIKNPTEEQVKSAIYDIEDNNGSFLILDNGSDFIQVALGSPNQCVVEYKEDGKQFHCVETSISIEIVKDIFINYYYGNSDWKNVIEWKPLDDTSSNNSGCAGVLGSVLMAFILLSYFTI